jgi:hypothetical protein
MSLLVSLVHRRGVLWLAALGLLVSSVCAVEVPLQTELKVSGPAVSLVAPLGLRYRPGVAFPLQIRVYNPGSAFSGEILLAEGDAGERCTLLEGLDFPERTARVFTLPVRAPAVSANLTLSLRERNAGGGIGALRFQASLARVLKPLAPDARLILVCGTGAPLAFGPQEEVAQLAGREFPDEDWLYDNVDLVVLGDAALKDATPAAQQALRRWLLGGGRLLIAANEALAAAIAAGLLPLDEGRGTGSQQQTEAARGTIGSDRRWWEQHAGLTAGGILAQKNNRPVYIHLTLGFGEIALLFPATSVEDAHEFGAAVVNSSVLQKPRDRFPDVRVQPDRYSAFPPGVASPAARSAAVRWLLLGAAAFCLGLALAYTSRSRLVAAGWPLVVAAFMAVLLAKWFPERNAAVSRVQFVRQSSDQRALVTAEWACVEALTEPAPVAIAGQVTPLYADTGELRNAQTELAVNGAGPRLATVVYPGTPMLFADICVETPTENRIVPMLPSGPLHCRQPDGTITLPGSDSWARTRFHDAVLARADGTLWWLKDVDSSGNCVLASFNDLIAHIGRSPDAGRDDALRKSRATLLSWAARDIARSGRETVLVWEQLPGDRSGIIACAPPTPDAGSLFRILAIQTARRE